MGGLVYWHPQKRHRPSSISSHKPFRRRWPQPRFNGCTRNCLSIRRQPPPASSRRCLRMKQSDTTKLLGKQKFRSNRTDATDAPPPRTRPLISDSTGNIVRLLDRRQDRAGAFRLRVVRVADNVGVEAQLFRYLRQPTVSAAVRGEDNGVDAGQVLSPFVSHQPDVIVAAYLDPPHVLYTMNWLFGEPVQQVPAVVAGELLAEVSVRFGYPDLRAALSQPVAG